MAAVTACGKGREVYFPLLFLCIISPEWRVLDIICTSDTYFEVHMPKIFDLDKFDAFAKRATLGNFRLVNTNSIEWDCSNSCDNPQLVEMVFAERQQRQFHNGKYRDLTRDFINYERCEKLV